VHKILPKEFTHTPIIIPSE